MAQPTAFNRLFSFFNWTQQNPTVPQPGDKLDIEFNAVKTSIDQIIANIGKIQRDDGQLANASVGNVQLKAEVQIGVNPPSDWATGNAFNEADTVVRSNALYRCAVAHTAGSSFNSDLAAGRWLLIYDFSLLVTQIGSFQTGSYTGDGSTTQFETGVALTLAARVLLYENGLYKRPDVDFSVSGTKIIRANAPPNLAAGFYVILGQATVNTVGDGAIGANQLAVGAVTQAKMATNSVGTAQLIDANVTPAKLSSGGPSWDASGNLTTPTVGGTQGAVNSGAVNATGPMLLSAANPTSTLNKAASGQTATLIGQTNTKDRWRAVLGNATAEAGANAGSDFEINRYGDTGTLLGNVLRVFRSTGYAALTGRLGVNTQSPAYDVDAAGDINAGTALRIAGVKVGFSRAAVDGLVIQNDATTPISKLNVTASSAVLVSSAGLGAFLTNISVTIDLNANGANGLDTGLTSTSTWYNVFLIYNATTSTVAGLASASATAPTLPSGYAYWMRVGAVYIFTDGNLRRAVQVGRVAQYVPVSGAINNSVYPLMASGTATVWTSIAVGAFVPPTASQIRVKGAGLNGASTSQYTVVSPNSADTTVNHAPIYIGGSGSGTIVYGGSTADFVLEGANIYWGSTLTGEVRCIGWLDKVNAT